MYTSSGNFFFNRRNSFLQKSELARAGESVNRAAADYRQRRAKKMLRTQTAALLLWVQYLVTVGAVSKILHEERVWALSHFDPEMLNQLAYYAEAQQTPLPIIYAAHYCQHRPAAWLGVTWRLVEGFVKWLLHQGCSLASVNNRLSAVKVYTRLGGQGGCHPPYPIGHPRPAAHRPAAGFGAAGQRGSGVDGGGFG